MIDLAAQLNAIEQLMKLMKDHGITEVAVDYVQLKRPLQQERQQVSIEELAKEAVDQHVTGDQSDAPWDAIPESALQEFAIRGKA